MDSFWDGIKMGIDLLWGIVTAAPLLFGGLALFIAGAYLLALIVKGIKDQKLKKSGISKVDEMKGKEFENYLRVLFMERGYRVEMTPATGDYGADLILSQQDQKIVVQAKRYKKNVGIKAVQEVTGAKMHYRATECWVVTNSGYTEPAKRLAKSNQVRLVDRDVLMKWMLELNNGSVQTAGSVSPAIKTEVVNKK